MSAYELYLMLHIGAAIVWIGAGFLMTLLATRARAARDPARVRAIVADGAWLGLRLFLPANLIVLGSAILLVQEGGWSYHALWIRLGLLGFAVSFLSGALFFGPGWGRLAAADSSDGRSVEKDMHRLLVGSWLDVGWLLAIVVVMIAKPTTANWGALPVAAALPVCFALLALAFVRAP